MLAGVHDDELDRPPGPEEWPLRTMVEHLLDAESGFATSIELAVEAARAGRHGKPTEEAWNERDVKERPEGDVRGVRDALFRSHRRVLRFASYSDDEIETPSHFWESEAFPVRFRLHRFEEHMRQHTVQAEKTLIGIGHPPSEAERLIRHIYVALADVESASFGAGLAGAALDRSVAALAELADRVAART